MAEALSRPKPALSPYVDWVMQLLGPSEAEAAYAGKGASGFSEADRQGLVSMSPYDKQPKFEISDVDANLILPHDKPGKHIGLLRELYQHPELYNNYPELADVPLSVTIGDRTSSTRGSYNPSKNIFTVNASDVEDAKSTLSHEIQHWIQEKEGMASGGNLLTKPFEYSILNSNETTMLKDIKDIETMLELRRAGQNLDYSTIPVNKMSRLQFKKMLDRNANPNVGWIEFDDIRKGSGKVKVTKNLDEMQEALSNIRNKLELLRKYRDTLPPQPKTYEEYYNNYRKIAGENEAREVESRRLFTPEDRYRMPMFTTGEYLPEETWIPIRDLF